MNRDRVKKYNIWLFRRFHACKFLQIILSEKILRILGQKLHPRAKHEHAVPNRLAVPLRFDSSVHHPPDATAKEERNFSEEEEVPWLHLPPKVLTEQALALRFPGHSAKP